MKDKKQKNEQNAAKPKKKKKVLIVVLVIVAVLVVWIGISIHNATKQVAMAVNTCLLYTSGVKYHFDEREAVAEILDEIKSGERTVEA